MGVAGFVGGVTNHLAIKMLFHPRRQWRVFGMRVPFTPGLIPKRKDEIARSLGNVVADYLVTSQGLVNLLEKPETKERAEAALRRIVMDASAMEETFGELAVRLLGEDQVKAWKETIAEGLSRISERGVLRLWEDHGLSRRTLAELVPGWNEESREKLAQQAAALLLQEIRKELMSPGGERMLTKLVGQFMGQGGGFLGTLAGMFMDESKTADKLRWTLIQQLDSPQVRTIVFDFVNKKIEQLEGVSLEQLLEAAVKKDSSEWLREQAARLLPWAEWLSRAQQVRIGEWLSKHQETLLRWTEPVAAKGLSLLASNAERLLKASNLPALVEEQVADFPIERLEEIILSISGKEFRAITWLGVLLGAFIGLIQSLALPFLSSL